MIEQQVTLNFDQWETLFRPSATPYPSDAPLSPYMEENRIWTAMDDGGYQSGMHWVNRADGVNSYYISEIGVPEGVHVWVDAVGDVQTPLPILFAVDKSNFYGLLREDATHLPYVFWDLEDAQDWLSEQDNEAKLLENYYLVNQEGQLFDWDGEERIDD